MVTPTIPTDTSTASHNLRTRHRPWLESLSKNTNTLLLMVAAAALTVSFVSIVLPMLSGGPLQSDGRQNMAGVRGGPSVEEFTQQQRPAKSKDVVEVVDLEHEELFRATIKSCVNEVSEHDKFDKDPNYKLKCKEFIPDPLDPTEHKIQRVAVITPPGDISVGILSLSESIMYKHNHLKERKLQPNIELIPRNNVPPYGYGKTHGLTKIIRIVPQPLLLEVTNALQVSLQPNETHKVITLQDLTATLRMMLRFHCRLSHVAAHTSILSVNFLDLFANKLVVQERLEAFLTPHEILRKEMEQGDDDGAFDAADDAVDDEKRNSLFDRQESFGTDILTHIRDTYHVDVNKVMDDVLMHELNTTKNLSVWPCPSFFAVGDPDPYDLGPLVRRIAEAMAPDCDDPLASCFVKRDKCEAAGDGPCQGKPKEMANAKGR